MNMRVLTQTTPLQANTASDVGTPEAAALRNGAPADTQDAGSAEMQALFSAMLTGLKHASSAGGKAPGTPDGQTVPRGLVLRNLAQTGGAQPNASGPMLRNTMQPADGQRADDAGEDSGAAAPVAAQPEPANTTAADPDASASPASPAPTPEEQQAQQLAQQRSNTLSVLDAHAKELGTMSFSDLDKKIDDPKTPPDLKQALQSLKNDPDLQKQLDGALNGKSDGKFIAGDIKRTLADQQLAASPDRANAINVLQRHEGELGTLKFSDLDKKINDPKTPPDLKAALQTVKNDPGLQQMLDSGKNGKTDGKFSGGDVKALSSSPTLIAMNQKQASSFEKNYIPSDDTSGAKQGRPMTANDAERELYRYSDNLPDPVTKDSLQQIVDGTGSEGKRPPQVIAAAQYYLDHPDDWQKLAGNADGKVKRGKLEDAISSNVELNADETATVKTMQANSDAFFKDGNLTRDKLKTLSNDPNPDVAKAAKQLLNDPMLFGMMDNALHGNSGSFFHAADDGKISKKDFDKFTSTMNKTPAPTYATQAPSSAEDASAVAAMQDGEADQPDTKAKKGGQFQDFLHGLLTIASKIEGVVSKVLGVIADLKIPLISQLAAAGSVGAQALSSGYELADTALEGGDMKQAGIKAGFDVGGAALGALTVPGAGTALKGAESAALNAAYQANKGVINKTAAKEAGKQIAKDGAKEVAGTEYDDHKDDLNLPGAA